MWTRHLAKCMGIAGRGRNKYHHPFLPTRGAVQTGRGEADVRNGGTSTLNSPMYKELSSDDEESFGPSLFAPDIPTRPASQSPSHDDDDFTPASTGSTSKKGVPKKRKKDLDKPPKPRKPRAPKNPSDSPSKTHVNRFKQNLGGEMVRTVSESPLAGGGGSTMARVSFPPLTNTNESHGPRVHFNLLRGRSRGLRKYRFNCGLAQNCLGAEIMAVH
jgi:hypothetical protein